jgi:hypothetical protein
MHAALNGSEAGIDVTAGVQIMTVENQPGME